MKNNFPLFTKSMEGFIEKEIKGISRLKQHKVCAPNILGMEVAISYAYLLGKAVFHMGMPSFCHAHETEKSRENLSPTTVCSVKRDSVTKQRHVNLGAMVT